MFHSGFYWYLLFLFGNVFVFSLTRAEECTPIPDPNSPTGYAKISVSQTIAEKESHNHHNHIIRMVSKFLNEHFDDIATINIDYDGKALSGKIGKYVVIAHLNRISQGVEVTECRTVDYWVEDVDECELGTHRCHSSAFCRNTIGSYDCVCPAFHYGIEGSGSVSFIKTMLGKVPAPGVCGGKSDTSRCCNVACTPEKLTTECLDNCKADFRCTDDPCLNNKCHENAVCLPVEGSFSYECQCKEGYSGDGFTCEKEVPHNFCIEGEHTCVSPCICTNVLAEKAYRCEAPHGFIVADNPFDLPLPHDHVSLGQRNRRLDHNYCFSKDGMDLHLDGPNPMVLQQGDSYEEYGLQVSDSQPENFIRRVSIHYSSPFGLYFKHPATYDVFYTIQTPWLELRPNITKIRKVIINDVDECKYDGPLLEFRHKCSEGAQCINTVGSYECKCPAGYEGDGLKNSTACKDVRPPTLHCTGKGCNPMKFKAVSCVGIMSEDTKLVHMEEGPDLGFIDSFLEKRKYELCTDSDPCYVAFDDTMLGRIDLTSKVQLGKVAEVSRSSTSITYAVPLSVVDEAGNPANSQNLLLEVEIINVIDHLSGALVSMPRQKYVGAFAIGAVTLVTVLILFLPSIFDFLRVGINAIQYVLCPYTLLSRRQDYEEGMDLILRVLSLGLMSKTERLRRIATKWNQLVASTEQRQEDDSHGN